MPSMNDKPEFPYAKAGRRRAGSSKSNLGASNEMHLFSLAQDGLECIAGVGQSHINFLRANFPMHVHPGCIEVHYCLRGSLTFATESGEFRCMPGDVFLTQPKVAHHLVERRRGQRHFWLLFKYPARRGTPVLGLSQKESDLLCRRLAAIDKCRFPADSRLKQLFQNLFAVCNTEPRGAFRTIKLKSIALMILLVIIACAERGEAGEEHANRRLMDVIADIRRNPAQTASIDELARRAALSESRFSFLFKQATGLPPHAFIVSCRIEEARRRLRDTDDRIAKIARDLGFASPRHLTMQFRQHCDMSPRQFRDGRAT